MKIGYLLFCMEIANLHFNVHCVESTDRFQASPDDVQGKGSEKTNPISSATAFVASSIPRILKLGWSNLGGSLLGVTALRWAYQGIVTCSSYYQRQAQDESFQLLTATQPGDLGSNNM